jgi:hypothetical protein
VSDSNPFGTSEFKTGIIDYSGQSAATADGGYLLRMRSNLRDAAVGIDMSWAPYLLRISGGELAVSRIPLPATPAWFYPRDADSFYVHYYMDKWGGDYAFGLYILSF